MEGIDWTGIAALKEGVLRQNGKGRWGIQQADGKLVWLDELLMPYRNKRVRLTCADLKEAQALAKTLEQGDG